MSVRKAVRYGVKIALVRRVKRAGVDEVQLKRKLAKQERIFQNLDSNSLCGSLQMQTYFSPPFRVERSDERKYICIRTLLMWSI